MTERRGPALPGSVTASEPLPVFEYLRFAKERFAGARFPLSLSGVPDAPVAAFVPEEAREPVVEGARMAAALAEARALGCARWGVPPGHLYPTLGTSGAVYLALAALGSFVPQGAAIAVESPAYGVFRSVAQTLRREVVDVPRREDAAWAVDVAAVRRAFERGARIFCVTDLHNPTGAALSAAETDGLRTLAREFDAWVLLDEVYRDFLPGPVATGYRAGERVVATTSLTKCYGLGGLRAGFLFAPPDVVAAAERVEEVLYGVAPVPTAALVVHALRGADALLERGRAAAALGRPVVDAWMASTPHVSWTPPAAGISGLVRVEGLADSMRFAERLREELGVQVVPGAFFGAEGTIRVSFGLPPAQVAAALDVLALGIGALRLGG